MEAAGDDFHRRVNDGYRALAAAEPDRWLVVDAGLDPEAVEAAVWKALGDRLPDLAGPASAPAPASADGVTPSPEARS